MGNSRSEVWICCFHGFVANPTCSMFETCWNKVNIHHSKHNAVPFLQIRSASLEGPVNGLFYKSASWLLKDKVTEAILTICFSCDRESIGFCCWYRAQEEIIVGLDGTNRSVKVNLDPIHIAWFGIVGRITAMLPAIPNHGKMRGTRLVAIIGNDTPNTV